MEKLYKLIHALTPTEKRYFKLQQNKAGSYVKLFDVLAKMNNYNKTDLQKQIAEQKLRGNTLVIASQLQDIVINTLVAYKSKDNSAERQLEQIRILATKGLHDIVKSKIEKLKKTCYSNEKWSILVKLLDVEWLLRRQNIHNKETINSIKKIYHEKCEVIKIVENLDHYKYLSSITFHKAIIENDSKDVDELAQEIDSLPEPLSVKAEIIKANILANFNFSQSNFKEVFYYRNLLYKIHINNPALVKAMPLAFIVTINNLLVVKRYIKDYKGYEALILSAELLNTNYTVKLDSGLKWRMYEMMLNHKLIYSAHLGLFKETMWEFEDEFKNLEQNKENIRPYYYLFTKFNFAYLCFGAVKYEKAQDVLIDLINDKSLINHYILNLSALFLEVLILYEMKSFILLESKVRALYRFILRREESGNFERLMLQVIRIVYRSGLSLNKKAILKCLNLLESFNADENYLVFLDKVNIVAWLRSKLEGRTLSYYLKSKYPEIN